MQNIIIEWALLVRFHRRWLAAIHNTVVAGDGLRTMTVNRLDECMQLPDVWSKIIKTLVDLTKPKADTALEPKTAKAIIDRYDRVESPVLLVHTHYWLCTILLFLLLLNFVF